MKKFVYFIDVKDKTWLVNIDHIKYVEQYNGDACKSVVNIQGCNIWMKEPVGEIYDMIEKHFNDYENSNSNK